MTALHDARPRPAVKVPREPDWSPAWVDWFVNEVEPLFHSGMETNSGHRREWTRDSPLRFALTYLDHHLVLQDSDPPLVTFNEMHLALCRAAKRWREPRRWREAWVAPRGVGKALALDTPVLTVDRGWTTHGDLRVGDRVFDETGAPCNVVRISERWADRPSYRITFSDGEQVVADENHEWYVNDRYSDLTERIENTARISEKWLLSEARGWREVRYSVPVAGPLQYPAKNLPLAPYVLGAWLGDGTSSAGAITVGSEDVAHLVAQLRAEGENPVAKQYTSSRTAWTVQLAKPRPHLCPREHELELIRPGEGLDRMGRRGRDKYRPCRTCVAAFQWHGYRPGTSIGPRTNRPLITRLREMDLLGNKHIPEQYLTASSDQRLALLQGLMDTDGTIGKRGTAEFTSMNERLAHDMFRLVTSMGIKVRIREERATIKGADKGPKWRVVFHTSLPVFRLPRKLERVPETIRAAGNRRIVNVERVENQTTSCIEVDSPWHLYLVGRSLIPTHNSSWCFLALPLWALAHGHRSYFMAFSATTGMAQAQLANLRYELAANELMLQDYPELRPRKGWGASNTKSTVVANGGTVAAAGLGENMLGRKSGASRPDLIVMDDIEKMDESMSEREKRGIILDIVGSVIPMASPKAAVGIFGTPTSYGSVIHDLAQHARGRERVDWVANNEITSRLFPGIRIDPDTGVERSLWPERWGLTETHLGEWLRRTPTGETPDEFKRNFLLDPTPFGTDAGSFWKPGLIVHKDESRIPGIVEHVLYLDVAVTDNRGSDEMACVIVGRHPGRLYATVEYAGTWKFGPEETRQRVHNLLREHPTVRTVIVENNQGGDLWLDVLNPSRNPLPRGVELKTEHAHKSKRDRVVAALQHYERGEVFHTMEFVDLERQMVMFPSAKARDDLVDALTGALRWAFAK